MEDKTYKSLVWKFFWQQKKEEVLDLLAACWPLLLVLFIGLVGYLTACYPLIMIPLLVVLILILIIGGIGIWLKLNYEKAKSRAAEEIKERRSKRC